MSQSSLDGQSTPAGDPRVEAVVARLADLDGLDLPAQLEVFADLQASLASVLDSQHSLDADPDHAPMSAS